MVQLHEEKIPVDWRILVMQWFRGRIERSNFKVNVIKHRYIIGITGEETEIGFYIPRHSFEVLERPTPSP